MIEEIYRVQVFYEDKRNAVGEAYDQIFLTNDPHVLTQDHFLGCPAAGPYLTVECDEWETAKRIEKVLTSLVKKARGKVL